MYRIDIASLQENFRPLSHVFDTYAKTNKGKTLHFDVVLDEQDQQKALYSVNFNFRQYKIMKLNLEKMNEYSVIFIQEERIDAHNSGELKEYILRMIEHGNVNIIVQLENVRFIDSSGLGALLSGYKNAAAKSGKLALACCKQQVLSMFELTRLNRVFEIYNDLNEAFENEA